MIQRNATLIPLWYVNLAFTEIIKYINVNILLSEVQVINPGIRKSSPHTGTNILSDLYQRSSKEHTLSRDDDTKVDGYTPPKIKMTRC